MSFNDYYNDFGYGFNTTYIDGCISDIEGQESYCKTWINKFEKLFSSATPDEMGEWFIRSTKSIWEMYASATMLTEARCSLSNNCYVSYYFCLYYALFHAIWSLLYMTPEIELAKLYRVTHSALINKFMEYHTGKEGMFSIAAVEQFENLKYKREYYSYNSPLNLVFPDSEDELRKTNDLILSIFQTVELHSFMANTNSKGYEAADLKDHISFHYKFIQFFSNVNVPELLTERDALRKKRESRQASYRRYDEKKKKLILAVRSGDTSVNNKMISETGKKAAEAKKDLDDIVLRLSEIDKELANISVDESAQFALNEVESGKSRICIAIVQFEVDHMFDEFHGYDGLEITDPISFNPREANNVVYSSIM